MSDETPPAALYARLLDEDGVSRPVSLQRCEVPPEDLPAFLDHSVRYSLVNVWLHESEQWLENVLVPLYRMGEDADDPAPVLPSLDAYLMRRRRRLGG